jgi:hypothetical protein
MSVEERIQREQELEQLRREEEATLQQEHEARIAATAHPTDAGSKAIDPVALREQIKASISTEFNEEKKKLLEEV